MSYSVVNDLAKAMKALDGKKQPPLHTLRLVSSWPPTVQIFNSHLGFPNQPHPIVSTCFLDLSRVWCVTFLAADWSELSALLSCIDEQMSMQLGVEGIGFTDVSTVHIVTVQVQQSYTELANFRAFC